MRTCVIVPTYNNAATLPAVLEGVRRRGLPLIVVDDGSTDRTPSILASSEVDHVVTLKPNQGKGFALCAGFEAALRLGFSRAITIDSDLQHDPRDIPRFMEAARARPQALIVGVRRNLRAMGAPLANRFGNAASNLYFFLLTGRRLADTQSGYRSYPLGATVALGCPPSRFEYEFVVLVAAARSGLELASVPIKARYERDRYVSHFRPVKDFLRIFLAGLRAVRLPRHLSSRRALGFQLQKHRMR